MTVTAESIYAPDAGKHPVRNGLVALALVLAAAGLTAPAFPPWEWWWIAWFAPVPLLLGLRRALTLRGAGLLALIYGMALCAGALSWMHKIFESGTLGIYLIASAPWFLFGLAYHACTRRLRPSWLLLMTPVLWVATDWIRCEGWYFRFSWLQLGQSQVPWSRGLLLYPYVGVFGVTFLIILVNAALAHAITLQSGWRTRLRPLALTMAFLLPILLLLPNPNPAQPRAGQSLVARVVQGEGGEVSGLRTASLLPATEKPMLIVWPEYALPAYVPSDPYLLDDVQQVARAAHATLVLGCKEHAPDDAPVDWLRKRAMLQMNFGKLFYNLALVLGPEGAVIGKYYKTHPIQFFSDGVPGRLPSVMLTPAGRLGLAICYDFDYASSAVRMVHDGAELLVVPTFDEVTWGSTQHQQHARIAQARAAEAGRWTVRATSSGVSQIINPRGELTASIPATDSILPEAITGVVGRETGWTLYMHGIYLLPYACVFASLLALLLIVISAWNERRISRRQVPGDTAEAKVAE